MTTTPTPAPQAILDTTPPDRIPDLNFPCPPCGICHEETDGDGDSWLCYGCRIEWVRNGTDARWFPGMPDDYDAPRVECGDKYLRRVAGFSDRLVTCRLHAGHDQGDGAVAHAGYATADDDTPAAYTSWDRWYEIGGEKRWTW